MKAIRIRLRWLNLGAVLATVLFLWLESLDAEEKKKKLNPDDIKFGNIVKHYEEKYNA